MTSIDGCRIIDVVVEEDEDRIQNVEITELDEVDEVDEFDEVEEPTCVAIVAPIPRSPPLPTLTRHNNNSGLNKSLNPSLDDFPIKPSRNTEELWTGNAR